jgi:hypothetical protein
MKHIAILLCVVTWAVLGAFVELGHPDAAYAYVGGCHFPLEDIRAANYGGPIFVGTVLSVRPLEKTGENGQAQHILVENRFQVIYAVKDITASTVTVFNSPTTSTYSDDLDVDYPFTVGENYVVFATVDKSSGALYTKQSLCTGTTTIETAGDEGILNVLFGNGLPEVVACRSRRNGGVCPSESLPTTGNSSNGGFILTLVSVGFLCTAIGGITRKLLAAPHRRSADN